MEFCVKLLSFPSWERGLKYKGSLLWGGGTIVVPLVGAWIEIRYLTLATHWEWRRSPRGSVD